eukprot:scpid95301/ scgid10045/ 
MDCTLLFLMLFVLAVWSASFVSCGKVGAQFQCSQENENISRITCDINHWSDARYLRDEGIFVNLTMPSNDFKVIMTIRCPAMFTQNVLLVSRQGFENCNGTEDELGRRHVLTAIQLPDDEATIHACYRYVLRSVEWQFEYQGQLVDNHYFIGTVKNPNTFNPHAVGSLVDGMCSDGLKANIQLNWQQPPTPTPTTMPLTTMPVNTTVAPTRSCGMRAVVCVYVIILAALLAGVH